MNGPTPGAVTGTTSYRAGSGDLSWQERGACRTYGQPDLWFTVGIDRVAQLDRQEAKRVCLTECPVLAECRAYALAVREPDGIWGGLDEQDRQDVYVGRTNGACGTGSGRSRHERNGTPVCGACRAYENRRQDAANLKNWERVGPLLDRGLTYEQAAVELGLSVTTVQRAHQVARRAERAETAA